MSLSLRTLKMLWGRSANRCAICRRELTADATATDDPAVLGEACHIVAREPAGPRGVSPLSAEARDLYANLILLCPNDHTIIDSQPDTWPIERLEAQKSSHEAWVRTTLEGYDAEAQAADERYAAIVTEWEQRIDVPHWRGWSSSLLCPQPHISGARREAWNELRAWLLARIWPGRRKELEDAFENFRLVLETLQQTLDAHLVPLHDESFITEKFYKINEWNSERYERLLNEYEAHVERVNELTRELTRAANYVCDQVRRHLEPSYRFQEGVILAESGPYSNMQFQIERLEYPVDQRWGLPFARTSGSAT